MVATLSTATAPGLTEIANQIVEGRQPRRMHGIVSAG
jgi:hypothetical protein